ncbi:unnamed protein product [Heligmosomoides polygyrus]|uniref:Uncharacterized protein n=1 Tax=Heligmosomoides polygyrus TaxID=6339 RepID=A0A183FE47_HELPZ|nr:unnamed protein product [Heligmosomoides polygyrus]
MGRRRCRPLKPLQLQAVAAISAESEVVGRGRRALFNSSAVYSPRKQQLCVCAACECESVSESAAAPPMPAAATTTVLALRSNAARKILRLSMLFAASLFASALVSRSVHRLLAYR